VGEDIEVYSDEARSNVLFTWHGLRQQTRKPVIDGVPNPNQSLADFIAPKDSGIADYIGLFALTAGLGMEKREALFAQKHDDYGAIMLKAIADRLAEAFAELMHERVRKDLWGYAADEALTSAALIRENYRGIRPAPGYPACPEHAVKQAMFTILTASEIGMTLTENFAMTPASSVSGFYLAHPQARYFNVGRIGRDQLDDLARRRQMPTSELERWLAPSLG
jgi:5-methyltetrahydrofolate--homocysteine methyltransferase